MLLYFGLSIRPLLTQSDSASRKRPFSTGLFFDWILLVLLIVSPVNFILSVLALEAVGVREYCCTAVWQSKIGWQLCALRIPREQRVLRARRTVVQAGWWRWTLAESRQRYVCLWRCTQPRAAKATAGVAVTDKLPSIPRASVVVYVVVVIVVVVVVLTLTRILKSVVTGQAPVTLELRNTPGKNTNKTKVVHAYITAYAIHVSTRNI